MMDAKELRIGNLIYSRTGTVKIVDVINSTKNTIEFDDNDDDYPIYSCKPIPLTEEILEKNNFEYEINANRFDLLFSLTKYDFCFSIYVHNNEFYYFINGRRLFIKYVHELQNIFFTLTGEELQINL